MDLVTIRILGIREEIRRRIFLLSRGYNKYINVFLFEFIERLKILRKQFFDNNRITSKYFSNVTFSNILKS